MKRLSVLVTVTSGNSNLGRCLDALHRQHGAKPDQIIVPVLTGENMYDLRKRFPAVQFVTVQPANSDRHEIEHVTYDRRRATGLSVATGEIIAMTEDHAIPDETWCASILKAHEQPYAVIGGAVRNMGGTPLNWALYYCDFGRYQHPLRGSATYVTDVNVSYKRTALERVRSVWRTLYHETWVHDTLRSRGETLWLAPEVIVHHDRGPMLLGKLLKERFLWARLFAGRRTQSFNPVKRLAYAALSPLLPLVLIGRRGIEVCRHGHGVTNFIAAVPFMCLLTASWAAGEFLGYVSGQPYAGAASAVPVTLSQGSRAR
jgi:Glycosyl transferase family 2